MFHKYVKYEKLSREIKDEISNYHKKRVSADKNVHEEDSISSWFEERFDTWIFEKFKDASYSDKRKFFRIDVEIPIKIVETLIESTGEDSSAIELVGNVVNISRGGLYFKYNRPIEMTSIVKLMIDFSLIDSELTAIEALAMVVRVDDFDNGQYGVGVLFSSIYDDNKINLDVFILKRISNYLSSSREGQTAGAIDALRGPVSEF